MSERFPLVSVADLAGDWKGSIKIGPFGSQLKKEDMVEHGVKVYGQENVIAGDWSVGERRVSNAKYNGLKSCELHPDDIVMSMMGTIGRCSIFPKNAERGLMDSHLLRIQPNLNKIDRRYMVAVLQAERVVGKQIAAKSHGSIMAGLSSSIVKSLELPVPPLHEQPAIARILDTLDTQIRRTEALIAKLEQIKQGLLTDLLTRGIDDNGQVRPPPEQAPHLYKDSPLGRIPREWRISQIGAVVESAVDGPFGSNLKTEHYVEHPGVRVVRLQNVKAGWYDDTDRAFITITHAMQLARNEVLPGDLLVAGLGEETNPLGRACLYPSGLPPAINKADCYRLRSLQSIAHNAYIMHFLNSDSAAAQVRRYQQGVTLQRINLRNLRGLLLPIMSLIEQEQICGVLNAASEKVKLAEQEMGKLQEQKAGLMDDLLTGRVRVTALLDEAERAAS